LRRLEKGKKGGKLLASQYSWSIPQLAS
jgi:hypothetical protein